MIYYRANWFLFLLLFSGCIGKHSARDKHEKAKAAPPSSTFRRMGGQKYEKKRKPFIGKTVVADPLSNLDHQLEEMIPVIPGEEQAIVLLHGLNRHSADFDLLKQALKSAFPGATIIALESVNKDMHRKNEAKYLAPTLKFPIKEQARLAYEEIKRCVGPGKHLVIVGHSQGGLRGFTLLKEYGAALKRDNMSIIRLITIGTPWKGAPVLEHLKEPKVVTKQLSPHKHIWQKISPRYDHELLSYLFKIKLLASYPYLLKQFYRLQGSKAPGATELSFTDSFIKDYIKHGIKDCKVPITAIAGVMDDFSKLFPPKEITEKDWAKLNAVYAELIGGHSKCEHDMLLPVSTQHAEGLADIERIKVLDACHGNKVGIAVKPGLSELTHADVIAKVIETIRNSFSSKSKIKTKKKLQVFTPSAA